MPVPTFCSPPCICDASASSLDLVIPGVCDAIALSLDLVIPGVRDASAPSLDLTFTWEPGLWLLHKAAEPLGDGRAGRGEQPAKQGGLQKDRTKGRTGVAGLG